MDNPKYVFYSFTFYAAKAAFMIILDLTDLQKLLVVKTLEFFQCSGLKMNMKKTQMAWINFLKNANTCKKVMSRFKFKLKNFTYWQNNKL